MMVGRATQSMLENLNTPAGREKLVASIIICALGDDRPLIQTIELAMELHGLALRSHGALAIEATLRIEAMHNTRMAPNYRELLQSGMVSDRFALHIARSISKMELIETSDGLIFDAGRLEHMILQAKGTTGVIGRQSSASGG